MLFRSEGEDSWMYLNGNIVLAKDYYVYVEDIKNINTTSKPSDYEKVREYTIVDPKKDAYMVLSGELGYQVIRIIGKQ